MSVDDILSLKGIAKAFVSAREEGRSFADYPGQIPASLDESYAIQEEAIAQKSESVLGWKIGRLSPQNSEIHHTERLCGPIFSSLVRHIGDNEVVEVGVYVGGFAAVEAEFIIEIAQDTDAEKTEYTPSEAAALFKAVYAGVEMAGSPLPTINQLGPTVVASDFGNNNGLILSQALWREGQGDVEEIFSNAGVKNFKAKTYINDELVGEGGLFTMPSGPFAAVAWLCGHLAKRGRPLKAGQYISSGATTGIHDIFAGQSSRVVFEAPNGDEVTIQLTAVAK